MPTWQDLCEVVAAAHRDNPDRRLAPTPIERHHYFYMRSRLNESVRENLRELASTAALAAITEMGGLDPHRGSWTHPDPAQLIAGDGTWIKSLYQSTPQQAEHAARELGRSIRCDPDARDYRHRDGGTSRGYWAVIASWRGPLRQQRVVIDNDFRPAGISDATVFTRNIVNLLDTHPQRLTGLRAVVYDMALSSTDADTLLDAGVYPIAKTPRNSGDKPASVNLGEHTLTLRDGTQHQRTVIAVDGAACIETVTAEGTKLYLPLQRVHTRRNRHPRRCTFYNTYTVPDDPRAPADLTGATVTVRINSTPTERQPGNRSRSLALKTISEADDDFDRLHGTRQDTESNNSHLKSFNYYDRFRVAGRNNTHLRLLSYQTLTIITALAAHQHHTGTSHDHWFTSRPPHNTGRSPRNPADRGRNPLTRRAPTASARPDGGCFAP